jgi:large subunit ribosomal protein L29
MYVDDLRKLSDDKLRDQLEDLKESLFNLRFQKAFGQLEDQYAIGRTKRDVARVLMIMRERELAAQKEGSND